LGSTKDFTLPIMYLSNAPIPVHFLSLLWLYSIYYNMVLTCLGLEVTSCLLFWSLRDVDVWVLIKQKLHHDGDNDNVMERSTKDKVQWKKALHLWCVLLLMSLAYYMFEVEPLCWCSF
jgi:hypothetical protein